ncbi:acyltransferase [Methanolobus sp. WCC1]|uniref:acyltransferase n=1 Tax=unclassified Methanolobus TaxID=2629569 RepID=UPI00324F2641
MNIKSFYKMLKLSIYLLRKKYNDVKLKKKLMLEKNVFVGPNVTIDTEYPWLVSIGKNSYLTRGVIILSHDASTKFHLDYSKVGKVIIGENTFVGVNSVILPNVSIGDNVVIGAGSVVTHDIPDDCVAAGNPAKVIGSTTSMIAKHRENMNTFPIYKEVWTLNTGITNEMKDIMKDDLTNSFGYII